MLKSRGIYTTILDDGYNTKCQTCKRSVINRTDPAKKLAADIRYRTQHREELLEKAKVARAVNPEKARERSRIVHSRYTREQWKGFMLKTRYGLTLEQYNHMVDQQQGRCKICGKVSEKLVVDHKHDETKLIRGLLCAACNQAIGLMRDNEEHILAAIVYVQFDGEGDHQKHKIQFELGTR